MRSLKWLAYLLTAAMLVCLVPEPRAQAATLVTGGECLTPAGVYASHQWGPWTITKEATCQETGIRVRTCQRCRETQRETVPKAAHAYGPWTLTKAATCVSAGEETRICTVCGLKHTRDVAQDPEAHDFGEWQVVVPAEAGKAGLKRSVCRLCGQTREETIPPGDDGGAAGVTEAIHGTPGKCAITLSCEDSPNASAEGETGLAVLLVTNTGEEDLTGLSLDVQRQAEDGSFYLERLIDPSDDVIAPGGTVSCEFSFAPAAGSVSFTFVAAAEGVYSGRICTANCKYTSSKDIAVRSLLLPSLTVTKTETGTPPEGRTAYRIGDVIAYSITVSNSYGSAVTGTLYDQVGGYEETEIGSAELSAGESLEAAYSHTVTPNDAMAGQVVNTAIFRARFADPVAARGDETEFRSDPVYSPVEQCLSILKEEISHSLDLKGYVLGETVKFRITLCNCYGYQIDVVLWDQVSSLKDPAELGSFTLAPGETRTVEYTYDVRQEDVDNGFFDNIAYAEIPVNSLFGTRENLTVWSNEVRITVIDRADPPGTPVCRRVLTGCGSEGGVYECTFCEKHLEVEQRVRGLAGQEARAAWTGAVSSLYDDMAAKYPGAAKLAESDRTLFFAQLDLYEKMLTSAYGAGIASEMVLDELRDRCIDLCYALHTAPEARTDSVLRDVPELKASGAMPEKCIRTREKNSGGFTLTETLCTDHGYIGYVPDAASPGEEDFDWMRRLWEAALTGEAAMFRSALPASAKSAASDSLSAFLAWIDARGELLKALYNDGAVVQEVLAFTVRGRTLDLERKVK